MLLAMGGWTPALALVAEVEAAADLAGFGRLAPKRVLPESTHWIPICRDLAASRPTQTTLQRDCSLPCCREITSPSRTQSIPISRAPTEGAFMVRACCTNGLPYRSNPHTFTSRLTSTRGSGWRIINTGEEVPCWYFQKGAGFNGNCTSVTCEEKKLPKSPKAPKGKSPKSLKRGGTEEAEEEKSRISKVEIQPVTSFFPYLHVAGLNFGSFGDSGQ